MNLSEDDDERTSGCAQLTLLCTGRVALGIRQRATRVAAKADMVKMGVFGFEKLVMK